MKIEFNEYKFGASVHLTPETPAEVAQLARFANNAKAEKPSISLSFSTDIPCCDIYMNKVHPTVQRNSISPIKR